MPGYSPPLSSNTSAPSAWARLATLAAGGTLQNNPVGFEVDVGNGVIDIRGRDPGNSRKSRNVAANRQVAFVVDDIAAANPWVVRCLEVRGTAEALTGEPPPSPYVTGEVIRIHLRRIISWGIGAGGRQSSRRTIDPPGGPR